MKEIFERLNLNTLINKFKEIINKLINSKIVWIVLGSFLVILIIILIMSFSNSDSDSSINEPNQDNDVDVPNWDFEEENNYYFRLNGALELTLYVGEEYVESGFEARDFQNIDVSNDVLITGNVDTSKAGTYKITYSLVIEQENSITLTRTINVVERDPDDIAIRLNGSEIFFLPINALYKEQGAVAFLEDVDISEDIKITNNINNKQIGIYEVIYEVKVGNTSKKIVRQVVVFDLDSLINVTSNAKEAVIKINTNSYFQYTVLPNKTVTQNKEFEYKVIDNGTYEFIFYDETGTSYTKKVTISSIDRTAPNGTCKAILLDGKTTFTVTSQDNDIAKYIYNGVYESTSSSYIVNKFIRSSNVTLEDKVGNKRTITCQTELRTLPVIKPKSGESIRYQASSDSLVIYVTKNNGYYLTRIWAKDPVYQMRKELVTGNSYKRPKAILETAINKYNLRNKIVFGGNASAPIKVNSYYGGVAASNPIYNLKEPSSLLVYNGEVIINDYQKYAASTVIYYLDGSNQLRYIPKLDGRSSAERKEIFEEAIASGVYNTFAFNEVLVYDYKAQNVGSDYNAKRQGFCQVDSNNFILVTSDTKTWRRPDFAKFMQSIGCKMAVNFDGGGSVAAFYKPAGTNTVTTLAGNQRSLSSVMYFTELD